MTKQLNWLLTDSCFVCSNMQATVCMRIVFLKAIEFLER